MEKTNGLEIRRGAIVRITNPDVIGCDQQGLIVKIFTNKTGNPHRIGVRFPRRLHVGTSSFEHGQFIRYSDEDLRVEKSFDPLTADDLAKIISGSSMIRVIKPVLPLIVGETKCFIKRCPKAAWFEIAVNCWGTLHIAHVCPQHACIHNTLTEDVSWKKNIEFHQELNPHALDDN